MSRLDHVAAQEDAGQMLDGLVLDYLKRRKLESAAAAFQQEAGPQAVDPSISALPYCFLSQWFATFWASWLKQRSEHTGAYSPSQGSAATQADARPATPVAPYHQQVLSAVRLPPGQQPTMPLSPTLAAHMAPRQPSCGNLKALTAVGLPQAAGSLPHSRSEPCDLMAMSQRLLANSNLSGALSQQHAPAPVGQPPGFAYPPPPVSPFQAAPPATIAGLGNQTSLQGSLSSAAASQLSGLRMTHSQPLLPDYSGGSLQPSGHSGPLSPPGMRHAVSALPADLDTVMGSAAGQAHLASPGLAAHVDSSHVQPGQIGAEARSKGPRTPPTRKRRLAGEHAPLPSPALLQQLGEAGLSGLGSLQEGRSSDGQTSEQTHFMLPMDVDALHAFQASNAPLPSFLANLQSDSLEGFEAFLPLLDDPKF